MATVTGRSFLEIADMLPTREDLNMQMNCVELFKGEEVERDGKVLLPLEVSDDGNKIVFCGLTLERVVFITDNVYQMYGIRMVRPDWFTYNGLSADEVRFACKEKNVKMDFWGVFRTDNLRLNATAVPFLFPVRLS